MTTPAVLSAADAATAGVLAGRAGARSAIDNLNSIQVPLRRRGRPTALPKPRSLQRGGAGDAREQPQLQATGWAGAAVGGGG